MSPDPTGDDFRRLREEIVGELRELRRDLQEGYVRKDVQEAREAATMIQLKGLEDEQHQQRKDLDGFKDDIAAYRRWLISAFVAPVVVGVVVWLMVAALGVHK